MKTSTLLPLAGVPALLAVLLAVLPVRAEVYKWVDEKGVTHYSESPPPDKKEQAKKVDTSAPSGFGSSNAKAAKSAQDLEADFKQRRVSRIDQEQKEAKAADDERKNAAQKCTRARRSLAELRDPVPLYEFNEKGEKVYIEDHQRKEQIDAAEADIQRYCR